MAGLADRYHWDPLGRSLKRNKTRGFTILLYHRVNEHNDPFSIQAIAPAHFAAQMAYMRKHFSPLPLSDLLRRAQQQSLPPNAVSVTFDDGYRDNYEVAFPILQRYSIPATIFLTTGTMNSRGMLWYDELLLSFKNTAQRNLQLPQMQETLVWDSVSEQAAAAHKVLRYLRSITDEEREQQSGVILDGLKADIRSPKRNLMLTWDQIRALRQHDIEFGSHTVTHPILSQCAPDRVSRELEDSKKTIEEHLQEECSLFAYPSGRKCDITSSVVSAVSKAGYSCGLTIISGANHAPFNPFLLRRISAPACGTSQFCFHLAREKFQILSLPTEAEGLPAK
jgi:peptidoglycan/xylan/chitin deacetylase (PgdA/CDA1 family)